MTGDWSDCDVLWKAILLCNGLSKHFIETKYVPIVVLVISMDVACGVSNRFLRVVSEQGLEELQKLLLLLLGCAVQVMSSASTLPSSLLLSCHQLGVFLYIDHTSGNVLPLTLPQW